MNQNIPFFDLKRTNQSLLPETMKAVERVLSSGVYIGGSEVEAFENEWAQTIGSSEFVAVGNGLDGIRILLESFGIGEGDEVIVPGFTYYATWLGIVQAGAVPVAVDVDLHTANIDPTQVEAAIGPRTKAILAVHLFGRPAEMQSLREIADRFGLRLFEDVAQAHLMKTPIGYTGAISDGGAFSFYPTKNLGALGDAGGISTSDESAAARMRSRRSYGQGTSKYDHVSLGWNSRLDPIQAAILRINLAHLSEWTARRREIAEAYWDAISGTELEAGAVGPRDVNDSVWHHFVLAPEDRDAFRQHMSEKGISTDVHYPYFFNALKPLEPYIRPDLNLVNSEVLASRVISLPMGPWMTTTEVSGVSQALREFSISH